MINLDKSWSRSRLLDLDIEVETSFFKVSRFSRLSRLALWQCRDWESRSRHDQDKSRPPGLQKLITTKNKKSQNWTANKNNNSNIKETQQPNNFATKRIFWRYYIRIVSCLLLIPIDEKGLKCINNQNRLTWTLHYHSR